MEELNLPHLGVDLVFHMPESETVAYSFVHNVLNLMETEFLNTSYVSCLYNNTLGNKGGS